MFLMFVSDELIRDVLLWTPTHGRAKAGWPARTYIQQLCEDTGCCPEDLPRAINDREEWRERVRDIRATSAIWWWWWWCFLSFILVGFLLLHRDTVFTFARFFLTANVSFWTLGLALCLVGMHSALASMWALTKFSYSSFRIRVSDISWSALNFFLRVNVYLSLISQLLSRDLS